MPRSGQGPDQRARAPGVRMSPPMSGWGCSSTAAAAASLGHGPLRGQGQCRHRWSSVPAPCSAGPMSVPHRCDATVHAWNCGSSPSHSRAPPTTSSWPWPSESEELGFDAFFRSDHYLKMGDVTADPGPTDAWTTLAGLARDTSTIRLGTLVTAATFRLPGPLAISVATVDAHVGRSGRAGHRSRLVRRRAHRLRHPVPGPGRALRPARGAARGHRGAVDHAGGRDVLLRRAALHRSPTPRPCPSRCSSPARRSSSAASAPSRTPRLVARFAR